MRKIPKEPKRLNLLFILILIGIFILLRSLNFIESLNFSHDQGDFSYKVLDLVREKKITLIGPSISLKFEGREIFLSSASYYLHLLFLTLGNFDPIRASYLFMIFCAVAIFPLYYGVKFLAGKSTAQFMSIAYCLLPVFVDYTRFLWNPNYQLSLVPILIFLMGIYNLKQTKFYFFLISLFTGFLLQFHYQFVMIIMALFFYYFFMLKLKRSFFLLFITGLSLGFSPSIIFELRHNFYNTQTLFLYFKNYNNFSSGISFANTHYYLSILFFLLMTISLSMKKFINRNFNIFSFALLFFISLALYIPKPDSGFKMAKNWNYLDEVKVYKIVREENLVDFNIANLAYDTQAWVQKYLLKRDKINIDYFNYYDNRYLFIISHDNDYLVESAYEVSSFKPSTLIKQWTINDRYNLFLLEKKVT